MVYAPSKVARSVTAVFEAIQKVLTQETNLTEADFDESGDVPALKLIALLQIGGVLESDIKNSTNAAVAPENDTALCLESRVLKELENFFKDKDSFSLQCLDAIAMALELPQGCTNTGNILHFSPTSTFGHAEQTEDEYEDDEVGLDVVSPEQECKPLLKAIAGCACAKNEKEKGKVLAVSMSSLSGAMFLCLIHLLTSPSVPRNDQVMIIIVSSASHVALRTLSSLCKKQFLYTLEPSNTHVQQSNLNVLPGVVDIINIEEQSNDTFVYNKKALREITAGLFTADKEEKRLRSRGVLLYGPPGTGKTRLITDLARNVGAKKIVSLRLSGLVAPQLGVTESHISTAFKIAQQAVTAESSVVVVFIDEIDALFSGDPANEQMSLARKICEQLCIEMDSTSAPVLDTDAEAGAVVIVVAATNRPDRVPKRLLCAKRLDTHVLVGHVEDPTKVIQSLANNNVNCDWIDKSKRYTMADCMGIARHLLAESANTPLQASVSPQTWHWYDTWAA